MSLQFALPHAPATTPTETVTPIKLSESMRLGMLTLPTQVFNMVGDQRAGEGCAVRTILEGQGDDTFRLLQSPNPKSCFCGTWYSLVSHQVVHLNDDHRWSREKIAVWLEGLGL